jgi:D-citramalate synthase
VDVRSGTLPRAEVTVAYRGRKARASATGDGGYDAFMNALRKAVASFRLEIPRLEDFRVRIPPGGRTGALVETLITWQGDAGGESFSTLAVDSDQMAAAVVATEKMLNAVAARRSGPAARAPRRARRTGG